MPAVVKAPASRGVGDCAVVALAAYFERSYEEIISAAVKATAKPGREIAHSGLYVWQIKATAKELGHRLRVRRRFDPSEDEGIMGFTDGTNGHVAYVKAGLVWGMVNDQWEVDAYCAHFKFRPVSLLVTE